MLVLGLNATFFNNNRIEANLSKHCNSHLCIYYVCSVDYIHIHFFYEDHYNQIHDEHVHSMFHQDLMARYYY